MASIGHEIEVRNNLMQKLEGWEITVTPGRRTLRVSLACALFLSLREIQKYLYITFNYLSLRRYYSLLFDFIDEDTRALSLFSGAT